VSAADGKAELRLISPKSPLTTNIEALVPRTDINYNDYLGGSGMHNPAGSSVKSSIRGSSKTYEFVLWHDDEALTIQQKNILVQSPVLGFADPSFSTLANEPCLLSPVNTALFPEIEEALDYSFDWYTKERAADGDYGFWNYGDIQWQWNGNEYVEYRYWMNHGKGWLTP